MRSICTEVCQGSAEWQDPPIPLEGIPLEWEYAYDVDCADEEHESLILL